MKQGDLVFFKSQSNKWVDQLIKIFSRAKNNIVHVAIYVGPDKTIEANLGKKVGYATISEYSNRNVEYKTCPELSDEQRQNIIDYCAKQFGQNYDLMEILKMFFLYFFIKIPYVEQKMKDCSTLVWNAYHSVGIDLFPVVDCSPENLYDSDKLISE
jgi:cell wall-associated NlpC family hydrolase